MNLMTRRSALLGVLGAGVAAALAGCAAPAREKALPRPTATVPTTSAFLSGSSCIGASNGEFGRWRSKALATTATWVDDGSIIPFEQEFGSWTESIDFSPQYKFADRGGFSWAAVAAGTHDARFRRDLQSMRAAWGDRTATVYYRFQHEFNGNWFPWSATEGTASQFIAGWRRFADIFRETLQGDRRFQLVWCANGGTQSQAVRDIRTLWPGDDAVDVIGVDYYDFFPIASQSDWNAQTLKVDRGGGPIGIGAWHLFAGDRGKAIALPEWGNQFGDNPLFIDVMHEFFDSYRVTSPKDAAGNVLYEVYFNQRLNNGTPATEGDFRVQQDGADNPLRPAAAARYRRLWGDWAAI